MAHGGHRSRAGRGAGRWRAAACLLALGLAAATTARAEGPSLEAARAALEAGHRAAARSTLDSLLAGATLSPEVRTAASLLRADLEEDGTEYEHRLRDLADGELTPAQRARVQFALGQIAFRRGDLTFALRAFREASEAGNSERASLWVGLASAALGDGAAAREALEPLTDSRDRSIRQRALLAVGDTYRAAERWSDARNAYRKLRTDAEQDPGPGWSAAATLDEAECLLNLDEPGEAKKLLGRLLEHLPAAYEAPVARARLARLGEEAEAPETPVEPGAAVYSVQVGAFSVSENAEGLLTRLQGMGAPEARVQRGEDGLYRVFLGRFADRSRAESLGDSLSTELGLGFSVVRAP